MDHLFHPYEEQSVGSRVGKSTSVFSDLGLTISSVADGNISAVSCRESPQNTDEIQICTELRVIHDVKSIHFFKGDRIIETGSYKVFCCRYDVVYIDIACTLQGKLTRHTQAVARLCEVARMISKGHTKIIPNHRSKYSGNTAVPKRIMEKMKRGKSLGHL